MKTSCQLSPAEVLATIRAVIRRGDSETLLRQLRVALDSRDVFSIRQLLRRCDVPSPVKISESEILGITIDELWRQGRLALERGRIDSLAWFVEAIAAKQWP